MKQFIFNNRFFLCVCVIQLFVFSFLSISVHAQRGFEVFSPDDIITTNAGEIKDIRLKFQANMGDMPDIGLKSFVGVTAETSELVGGEMSDCGNNVGEDEYCLEDNNTIFTENGMDKTSATLLFQIPNDVPDGSIYDLELFGTYDGDQNSTTDPDTIFLPLKVTVGLVAIPTMSEWGLFLFFLTILGLSLVTLYHFQMATAKDTNGQTLTVPHTSRFPFNMELFKKAIPYALGMAALGFVVILMVWGAIGAQDGLGMMLAVPMLAYLVHLGWLMRKN